MLNWLINNTEWIFSGIGVLLISTVVTIFKKNRQDSQAIGNIDTTAPKTIYQANGNSQINIDNYTRRYPAKIQVIDVSIIEDDDHINPILDIKLRNSGDEVAFVKRIVFLTVQHWDIFTDRHLSVKNISATYEIKIPEVSSSHVSYNISHEIKPQETDRLQVHLSTDYFGDPAGLSLFLLDTEIFYNEDNSKTALPSILLNITPSVIIQGSYFSGYSKDTIVRNKTTAKIILGLPLKEIMVQDGIIEAVDSWLQAPDEY